MLDSAICPHLRTQRSQPKSTPASYEPAYPSYSARFDPSISEVAAVLIGAIASQPNSRLEHDALESVDHFLGQGSPQPHYRLLCNSEDPTGRETRAWKAYWPCKEDYLSWSSSSGFAAWWTESKRETEEHGWLLEALYPTMDRLESVFSNEAAREGAALMCQGMSAAIEEHGYWGSARDRFPIAQTDTVPGEKVCPVKGMLGGAKEANGTASRRVVVPGRQNLCVIHSGQDWSAMEGKERELYLGTLHPTLQAGMLFLSNDKYRSLDGDGSASERVGCFECRFMEHLDPERVEPSLSKSFGLCYFDDLASLERWSREHKTHLNIFNGFFKYAAETQGQGKLSLWHEIAVLDRSQQYFEYVNCPPGTGMLASVQKPIKDL
ncbi:phenylacetaldoxime dehydratase [Acaromyces ingoldii]|uniref:Phenylacetaldoxime dehydratase n=1 Tax=Acaromyces ingoldii TaxID=215250 RepID=A0A316YBN8_9BASI|nr:phenylacetaldoxime dehydratase [Acaromyces ingoldii]PWN86947.1 phenylacetaldoxime dehydratase [Acaromyces ingoldii]